MSRIGQRPIAVPSGVEIIIDANNNVSVKGPKGQLAASFDGALTLDQADGTITVTRPNDERRNRALHGLTIRARLLQHYENGAQATHYSWEITHEPASRESELLREYREALRYEPEATSYDIHNDLGVALAQLGRRQEALAEFERALQIKPDFADAKANKSRVLR